MRQSKTTNRRLSTQAPRFTTRSMNNTNTKLKYFIHIVTHSYLRNYAIEDLLLVYRPHSSIRTVG